MTALEHFNHSLNEIRDAFHKYGRLNDSNSKLDEISKLLAIELYDLKQGTKAVNDMLAAYASQPSYDLVGALGEAFKKVAGAPMFCSSDGTPVFGSEPTIALEKEDGELAHRILTLLHATLNKIRNKGEQFDLLNEAFGHFVRDNFRNNIEDAQYMTPQEVVDLIAALALERVRSGDLRVDNEFLACDPSCGVGSFLTTFYKAAASSKHFSNHPIRMIGQDKVPRMVRLTKLNMELFDTDHHVISAGNSLSGPSALDHFEGKVDLIITNPPFGASFRGQELKEDGGEKYPLLHDLFGQSAKINSEILFVDRYISLLKPGGEAFVVVPDSVISSKGIPEILRYRLYRHPEISLQSVIELPTVTFAQAGTRTKTSILHFKKEGHKQSQPVFIAKSKSLGFDVSTRKGATIKVMKGGNDLPAVASVYRKMPAQLKNGKDHMVLHRAPSCVLMDYNRFKDGAWTPNHYSAEMFDVLDQLTARKQVDLVPLLDLAEFVTRDRKKEQYSADARCISILHIVNTDILDYEEMLSYKPKYPGIVCRPGDLLFSKINPRIPRAIVVPEFDFPVTCSSEFEIIQPKGELNVYALKALLMLPSVQIQINHLTSGTSSSHNRIKSQDLARVLLPIPVKGSKAEKEFKELIVRAEEETKTLNRLSIDRYHLKGTLSKTLELN